MQVEGRDEARVYPEHVEPPCEQGRGQGLRGIPGPEIGGQRGTKLPGIQVGAVNLDGQAVLDVDEVADEPHAADDDEPGHAGAITENTQKRVDPREAERGGGVPGAPEYPGVAERGGGGEEEAVGAEETGGGGLVKGGESREAEPEVGDGVESEGLVVLGGGVVEAVEEEPRVVAAVADLGGGGGEDLGRNYGVPEPAHGGGPDQGWDWEVREDELR